MRSDVVREVERVETVHADQEDMLNASIVLIAFAMLGASRERQKRSQEKRCSKRAKQMHSFPLQGIRLLQENVSGGEPSLGECWMNLRQKTANKP
jgi:hypothetical protein